MVNKKEKELKKLRKFRELAIELNFYEIIKPELDDDIEQLTNEIKESYNYDKDSLSFLWE